jgi:glutamine synthetase
MSSAIFSESDAISIKQNGSTGNRRISDLFGENIFNMQALKNYVSPETYEKMKGVNYQQKPIEMEMVEQMAEAMIKWAMDRGVTHFCYWFQPLTNAPAEKHDAFFKPTINPEARGIESLSAGELIKRETDGSSFPSGGIRATYFALLKAKHFLNEAASAVSRLFDESITHVYSTLDCEQIL